MGIFCVHSSGPPAVRRADRRRSRHYGVRVGSQRAAPEGGKKEGRAGSDPRAVHGSNARTGKARRAGSARRRAEPLLARGAGRHSGGPHGAQGDGPAVRLHPQPGDPQPDQRADERFRQDHPRRYRRSRRCAADPEVSRLLSPHNDPPAQRLRPHERAGVRRREHHRLDAAH